MTEPLDADLEVVGKEVVAEGVVSLTLARVDRGPLPPWTPGAHIDVWHIATNIRQYSLCGDAGDPCRWRIGALREQAGRGCSRFLHDEVSVGSTLRVRGPRNHFPLVPSARYAFVAGGIGITPLLPMIATAEAAGATWRLLYGGRTRASMAFLDELGRYGDRVEVAPQDERGLLDLAGFVDSSGPGTLVYGCGPEPMLAALEQVCAPRRPDLLHVERFQPQDLGAEAGEMQEFEVVLARTGRVLRIPAGTSILDVLEAEGLTLAWSCREGTCGTCETAVLAGTPDHRDAVLTAEERESGAMMMICVSRARSESLTLDL